MSRFDKYLLSQLLALFGFFSLVLVAVYWVNRAVGLFDQLIGDGQSALVFLQFSMLTLPNVIRLVLPVSAFVAAVYVANRLMSESELVVMQATGFSSFRLARPVFGFGMITAAMMLILMNWLVPASRAILEERNAEISRDVSSRFLKDGSFLHPAKDITIYIRQISAQGELLDIFLSDDRDPKNRTSYMASRALFLKAEDGPKLLMFDGMMQNLDDSSARLSVTHFSDFTFDLASMVSAAKVRKRSKAELSTAELLTATQTLQTETRASRAALLFEAHSRFAQPFLTTAAALIGFASLLLGAYSRFGLWRQVIAATVLLLLVQSLSTVTTSIGSQMERGWILAYLAPVIGIMIAALELWITQRPRKQRKIVGAT